MGCDTWTEKLDAYLDGELPEPEARAFGEHLRSCAACATQSLSRVQQKRAIQAAGQRYTPDAAFRARIERSISIPPAALWNRLWLSSLAAAAVLIVVTVLPFTLTRGRGNPQLLGELTDLHVGALASANPVDVVSTDRHTVKPWFAGKIPFTFNLPELQDSAFTLLGGKVSYLHQSAGAQLIFRVRQHQISVFIFQDRALGNPHSQNAGQTGFSFNLRTWSQNGLRYFVVGDASPQDLDALSRLIKGAG